MSYTVKKLAKLSGATERTLRWYDEIGLLKPAYYGSNGYRYYEEEQLLMLQQILFYRELDFPLNEIRKVVTGSEFDRLNALSMHRKALRKNLERTKELLKTIDKTVLHIRGQMMMKDEEMYRGFREWSQGKGSESFFLGVCPDLEAWTEAEKIVFQSLKKSDSKQRDRGDYEKLEKAYKEIYTAIAHCLEQGLAWDSEEVQQAIERHYCFAEQFHHCTKEVYQALAELYVNKVEFRQQLEPFHPDLPKFMANAMNSYAREKL